MAEIPREAERLLATSPDEFVERRTSLARALRDEGRRDEADVVASIRKPSRVVLAVNRAARDRSQAAKDAAKAAERLGRTQLAGKPDEYAALVKEMEAASSLIGEVAVANLTTSGRATDAMRRRVADHIRGALSSKETRDLFVRGALIDEVEPAGFAAFAGLSAPKLRPRPSGAKPSRDPERERRSRQTELQREISDMRRQLATAERTLREASRERDELAARLERLEARRDKAE